MYIVRVQSPNVWSWQRLTRAHCSLFAGVPQLAPPTDVTLAPAADAALGERLAHVTQLDRPIAAVVQPGHAAAQPAASPPWSHERHHHDVTVHKRKPSGSCSL